MDCSSMVKLNALACCCLRRDSANLTGQDVRAWTPHSLHATQQQDKLVRPPKVHHAVVQKSRKVEQDSASLQGAAADSHRRQQKCERRGAPGRRTDRALEPPRAALLREKVLRRARNRSQDCNQSRHVAQRMVGMKSLKSLQVPSLPSAREIGAAEAAVGRGGRRADRRTNGT